MSNVSFWYLQVRLEPTEAERGPIVTALVTFDTMSEHIIRTGLIQVVT